MTFSCVEKTPIPHCATDGENGANGGAEWTRWRPHQLWRKSCQGSGCGPPSARRGRRRCKVCVFLPVANSRIPTDVEAIGLSNVPVRVSRLPRCLFTGNSAVRYVPVKRHRGAVPVKRHRGARAGHSRTGTELGESFYRYRTVHVDPCRRGLPTRMACWMPKSRRRRHGFTLNQSLTKP